MSELLEKYLYYHEPGPPDIKIYCGDCLDIMPLLPKVDLVVTDPPYGIGFSSQPTKWSRDNVQRSRENWDSSTPPQEVFNMMMQISQEQLIWGGNHFNLPPKRGWLVWAKPPGLPTYGTAELCWTNIDMPVRHLDCERCNGDKWNHPTQKPLKLIKWSIGFAKQGLLLDPFLGSGTTLVACKELKRNGIGIEINEKYCAIAKKRLKNTQVPFL